MIKLMSNRVGSIVAAKYVQLLALNLRARL